MGGKAFFDLVEAYQNWAGGVSQRVISDRLSLQKQMMAFMNNSESPVLAPCRGTVIPAIFDFAKPR
jgi:hypothetical protein